MDRDDRTKPTRGEPPNNPPVGLAMFDDDGDYIRDIGDQIAGLTSVDAASLQQNLRQIGAT